MFWLIFDAAAVIITLIMVVANAKKGFSGKATVLIGYLLATAFAWTACITVSPMLYQNYIKGSSIQKIEDALNDEKLDIAADISQKISQQTYGVSIRSDYIESAALQESSDFGNALYQIISENTSMLSSKEAVTNLVADTLSDSLGTKLGNVVPESAVNMINACVEENSDALFESVRKLIKGDNHAAAVYIQEQFIEKPTLIIVKTAVYVIVFLLVMIITRVVAEMLRSGRDSSPLKKGDALLGGLLGLLESAAWLIIISVAVKAFINLNQDTNPIVNSDVINSTIIFKYIYNLNIL